MDTSTPTPPPPPPKPSTPQAPPTPTKPQHTSNQPSTTPSTTTTTLSPPTEPFIPPNLRTYTVADLQYLSHSPTLLTSLFTLHHPTSHQSATLLTTALNTNLTTAQRLSTLESQLQSTRHSTQQKLLATRDLEQAWRVKEKEMYAELKRFSEIEVARRLREDVERREAEAAEWERELLEGAWEGGVEEWVKGYREKRKEVGLGRERIGRWGEGRVGGWR
ncbi:hypothetical protein EX30DRAFT_394390 [Ascodesmis nigricans]|uniref:VPS37 C-terminal domain-containing protein n=1 Tax=Ascodesmis nigricans TaxID=341454 RepID=A0A4S2N265_9PEZI|nr:hypothetical protein EX30DRAFT_394390 [Ascodesmis nigricans]